MTSPQPFVMPEDYFNAWSANLPLSREDGDSRVTASGFTTTTAKPPREKFTYDGKDKPSMVGQMPDQLKPGYSPESHQSLQRDNVSNARKSKRHSREWAENSEKDWLGRDDIHRRRAESVGSSPFSDKYRTMSDFTKYASDLSIDPNDSISNYEPLRVNKKPAPLKAITEVSSEIPTGTVIGGYTQNVDQKIMEIESYQDIAPVKGLPIIFTNPRLNFLTHVHSALFKIISDNEGGYPARNCGELLMADRRNWGLDPATKLLETVLDRTINPRTGIVVANPFNIPILEPTMELDAKLVYMAFDQLHNEFETEWFNTMKSVTTPRFHSKYEDRKFHSKKSDSSKRSSSKSTSERRGSGSSSGSVVKSPTNRSSSRSVVGSLFGLD